MALKTKVKVGKITNLSDARYCSGMGVDLLGFPVGAEATADLKTFTDISGWISGPAFVLEWNGGEVPFELLEFMNTGNAMYLEVRAEVLGNVPTIKGLLIVVLEIKSWPSLQGMLKSLKRRIGYLLLTDSENNTSNLLIIKEIAHEFPVLVGFGLSPDTLDEILSLPIAGIAMEGTQEVAPGLKDYSTLSDILEQLEISEA